MIIYKCSDKIPVTIGETIIWISPLSALQKIKILSLTKMSGGVENPDPIMMAMETLKCSVKAIDSDLKFANGDKVSLSLNSSGELDNESLDTLLEVADNNILIAIASKMINGGLYSIEIPGVSIDFESVVSVKKK